MTAAARETTGGRKPRRRLPERPLGPVGSWIAVVIIGLFVVNYWVASRSLSEPPRILVPYSPVFLDEVRKGNVDRITARGPSIQGLFKQPIRYPETGATLTSKRFSTLIPTFADTQALSKLLQDEKVVISAQPLDTAAPWWQTLLFGFGPTILLIGLLFFVMR